MKVDQLCSSPTSLSEFKLPHQDQRSDEVVDCWDLVWGVSFPKSGQSVR